MSRGVKDLRELICVSRLTIRESDDESNLSETNDDASCSLTSLTSDSSEVNSRVSSGDCDRGRSSDSGVGTNGHLPPETASKVSNPSTNLALLDKLSSDTRPTASRKKKRRKRNRVLATVPQKHELPGIEVLPPLAQSRKEFDVATGEDTKYGRNQKGDGNFDWLLSFLDQTFITEWLERANASVGDMAVWCHTGDNFVQFAHFWLSDFPDQQRKEIFKLEHGIVLDHLNLAFKAGRSTGDVKDRDIVRFMEAIFREYPSKLVLANGSHMFLEYLEVLTSERHEQYKRLLSDVRCSTRIRQNAQCVLAIRAFTLVSVWYALVDFYRGLAVDNSPSTATPIPLSSIWKLNPTEQRVYHAIRNGYVDVLYYLLLSGRVSPHAKDSHGRTLIFTASMYNQPSVLNFLLTKVQPSPDINYPADTGNTPLHAAANAGSVDVMKILLAAGGINKNPKNTQCENATPLHLAVMHGHKEAVEILLKDQMDLEAKMGDLSITDIAKEFEHPGILQLLTTHTST